MSRLDRRVVLALSVALCFAVSALYVTPMQSASAISALDFFVDRGASSVFFWEAQNKFVMIPQSDTTRDSADPVVATFVRLDSDDAIEKDTFDLYPVQGDQSDPINGNPCADVGGCPAAESTWTGGTRAVWCGETHCYTIWLGSNTNNQLLRFNSQGVIDGYYNISVSTDAVAPVLTGRDTCDDAGVANGECAGLGGVSLFLWKEVTGGANTELIVVGGSLIMGLSATSAAQSTPIANIFDVEARYHFAGTASNNHVITLIHCDSSLEGCVYNYDPNTNTITLTSTLGQYAAEGVPMAFEDSAVIEYLGDDIGRWLFCGEDGAGDTSCFQASASGSTGFGDTEITDFNDNLRIRGVQFDVANNMTYLYTSSGQTTAKVIRVNMTTNTVHDEFLSVGAGQAHNSLALDSTVNHRLVMATSGVSTRMVLLEGFAPSGTVTNCPSGQVPVTFPTGVFCVVVGSDGSVDLGGVNPLFGSNSTAYGIAGIPYALSVMGNVDLAIAKILATIFMVLLTLIVIAVPAWKFGASPPFFFWFLIVMMDLAAAFALGWIEPLYFGIMVVVAALGAGAKFSGVI